MVNIGPLTPEIGSVVWGTPANFDGVSRLGFLTAPTSLNGGQPMFARCLAVSDGANVPSYGRTRCRHLPNNIEPSVYGNDAPYVKLL